MKLWQTGCRGVDWRIWFWITHSGGHLWTCQWSFQIPKKLKLSLLVDKRLSAPQAGLMYLEVMPMVHTTEDRVGHTVLLHAQFKVQYWIHYWVAVAHFRHSFVCVSNWRWHVKCQCPRGHMEFLKKRYTTTLETGSEVKRVMRYSVLLSIKSYSMMKNVKYTQL